MEIHELGRLGALNYHWTSQQRIFCYFPLDFRLLDQQLWRQDYKTMEFLDKDCRIDPKTLER